MVDRAPREPVHRRRRTTVSGGGTNAVANVNGGKVHGDGGEAQAAPDNVQTDEFSKHASNGKLEKKTQDPSLPAAQGLPRERSQVRDVSHRLRQAMILQMMPRKHFCI